jgi:cation/acetate symporter
MSIVWKRFSTQGAIWSILVGAFTSLAMIVLSPTVWVVIFKFKTAVFPMKNPAIFSMTAAFAVGIVVSLLTPEKEAQEKFEDEKVRTYLGVGAE